MTEALFVVG